jgi:general secretion pathway protein K
VLWLLVILTILVFIVSKETKTHTKLVTVTQNQAKALALAESGVFRAVMLIAANQISESQQKPIIFDSRVYPLESKEGILKISIQEANGLININSAKEPLLKYFFASLNLENSNPEMYVDRILDWIDSDDLRRLHGAEKNDYLSAGFDYYPFNRSFNDIAELNLISGISPQIYKKISPYISTYSESDTIDLSSAPEYILLGLPGIDHALANAILNYRTENKTFPLSEIPESAKAYLNYNSGINYKISSYSIVGSIKSGVVANISVNASSKEPMVILSWQQEIDSVFYELD